MTYRKANINDITDIRASFNLLGYKDNLDTFFDKADGFIAIDKEIIGFTYGHYLIDPFARKKVFYLDNIMVRYKYEYSGIEANLLKCVLDYLLENNFDEMFIISDSLHMRFICKQLRGSSEFETTKIVWRIK